MSVPKNVKTGFSTNLVLVNSVNGDQKEIKVSFDPQNKKGKGVTSKPAPKKVAEPVDPDSGDGSISSTTWLIFMFLVCILYLNMAPGMVMPAHAASLSGIYHWLSQTIFGQHAGGYFRGGVRDADQSRSYYSAQGSNNASRSFYQPVKEKMFSSPDPQAKRDIPYNRFQQSRGSVISPQSMYKPVGGDSMYRDGGF